MQYDKERVTRLRNHILVKPSVSIERAECVTESYKETEGMLFIIGACTAFIGKGCTLADEIILGDPFLLTANGTIFNMRFSPNALKDRESMKKFESMLRQYLEEGGFFVQYNIVDTKTLRAAQKNPEEYKDLLVRVATYSAYFVELEKNLQEDIINRVAMEEMN